MDNYIGILATIQDVTQRSPETIGTAMNTIMSRFGNIKAGKFVATQEDMASADYDEENFSNLNDIETVLDTVGIKLRESYGVYRDIQDVLQDIADIWDTISQTEQNALASAIAGEYCLSI